MTHQPTTFLSRACLLAALVAVACPAFAQWQWLDASGKKVFSDMAPPLDVPEKNILQRPGLPTVPAKPDAAGGATADAKAAPDAGAAPSSATKTKETLELEAKKKKAEELEQQQKRAEADRAARAKADNCQRAQRALVTLNSGTPMRTMNAQGERVFMDDAVRTAEKTRLQAAVRQNCN